MNKSLEKLNIVDDIDHEKERFLETRIINLFELSEKERAQFQKHVERASGIIRVFVHPYFEWAYYEKDSTKQKIKDIQKTIEKLLSLPIAETPPLIFFEEQNSMFFFKERLRDMKDVLNKAYVVMTYPASPVPVLPGGDGDSWKALTNRFKDAGVKKIIVGGMLFKVYPEGPAHCVATTVRKLSEYFEVELSSLTSPDSRRELKKFELTKPKNEKARVD